MKKANNNPQKNLRKMRPALSPEARENQLVSLAVDLAEEQLRNGTASSQVITHYLKRGSCREKEKLELEKLALENELTKAKTEAVSSSKHIEELYEQAIVAMKKYSGQSEGADED